MPRKLLKRIMPDRARMCEYPHLRKFGQRLADPRLWHLNRRSVSGGIALGLFVGFMPVIGQMFIAAALAIWLRFNLPLASMAVWVTNPFTFAPIFFYAYKLGAWILEVPVGDYVFSPSWEWFGHELMKIWQPLLLGCTIIGLLAAIAGVLFVRIGWRLVVIHSWRKRCYKHHTRLDS